MELLTDKSMQRLYIQEHGDCRVEVCLEWQMLKTRLIVSV